MLLMSNYFMIFLLEIFSVSSTVTDEKFKIHHRVKRTLLITNGTRVRFQSRLTIPLPSLYDQVTGEVQITCPNIYYFIYTGFTARELAQDQLNIFSSLIQGLESVGFHGEACVKRTICEIAKYPKHQLGLFGDILDMIFSINNHDVMTELRSYRRAQEYGRNQADCTAKFHLCQISMFNYGQSQTFYN